MTKGDDSEKFIELQLDFAGVVVGSFGFLTEIGYRVVEVLPTLVRYERDNLCANVYFGRRSLGIGFEVVRNGQSYSLSELIRIADPLAAESYRDYVATSQDAIVAGIRRLRDLVIQYGDKALRGDNRTFDALDRGKGEWARAFSRDVFARQTKPKADAAFRARDYHLAVRLYQEIEWSLTDVERKKLALAKSRILDG